MSNLFVSLITSSQSLGVFERAMEVSQQNVSNASTPGYARQQVMLEALPFGLDGGMPGGVALQEVRSSRDEHAEQSVRRQMEALGRFDKKVANLEPLESVFDVTGASGIPAALENLFESFSAWSVAPDSGPARQNVLDRAGELAASFNQAAGMLQKGRGDTDLQLRQTATTINDLAGKVRDFNAGLRQASQDPGLVANLNATLEDLSQYVDITTLKQADGTVSVLMGGQEPLVIADKQYQISVESYTPTNPPPDYNPPPPSVRVLSQDGRDVTSVISGGAMGGLLEVRNKVFPSLLGDAYHAGDLNVMAKGFAKRVNDILTSGWISMGAQQGLPLFQYDLNNDTAVASSLKVNPITQDQLAAIDPTAWVSNGTALKLSALAHPQSADDEIQGLSVSEFFGSMASRIGTQLNTARQNQSLQQQMVTQARSQRNELSGVSLDEEAITMMQFQRAYQATARMITVLDNLTQATLDMIR